MSGPVFVEQEPNQGTEVPVEPGATIGREGCDITLSDPDVSRRHAAIQIVRDEVSIEDLGSTNGTFVNGQRIEERRRLSDGDEIQIGSTVWRLRAPASATRLVDRPSGATRLSQATSLRPSAEPPTEPPTPAAAPEPPAAAPEPPAPEPAAPPPRTPEPAAGEPPASETPAPEPVAARAPAPPGAGRRGDVPAPDFQPSAIRRVVPGPDVVTPFAPTAASRRKGSAATRMGATIVALIVVALTTAGVLIYYITEPFK
ncbi:MAG TPA: FHA domain-containing protein [Thermoleophilaceae bacterium]